MPLLRQCAVGPGVDAGALLHWSATLVALVTLNCFIAPAVADVEFVPEFDPAAPLPGALALAFAPPAVPVLALAVAEPLLAVAVSFGCPVNCTSLPIIVRTASRFPVNLYFSPDRSVRVKSPVIGVPERQPVNPVPAAEFSVPAGEFALGVLCAPVALDPAFGFAPDWPPEGLVVFSLAPAEPGEGGFEAGGVFGWFVGGFVVF